MALPPLGGAPSADGNASTMSTELASSTGESDGLYTLFVKAVEADLDKAGTAKQPPLLPPPPPHVPAAPRQAPEEQLSYTAAWRRAIAGGGTEPPREGGFAAAPAPDAARSEGVDVATLTMRLPASRFTSFE